MLISLNVSTFLPTRYKKSNGFKPTYLLKISLPQQHIYLEKLNAAFGSSITKGIYGQNNVIRSYRVHTCSFISKSLSALWQTGSVTFYYEEVTWAPATHLQVWILASLVVCVGKAWWKSVVFEVEMGTKLASEAVLFLDNISSILLTWQMPS